MQMRMLMTQRTNVFALDITASEGTSFAQLVPHLPPDCPQDTTAYQVTLFGETVALSGDERLGRPPLVHGASLMAGMSAPGSVSGLRKPRQHSHSPAWVIVSDGPDSGKVARLCAGQSLSIGRDPACGLSLGDSSLSRRHCLITTDRTGVRVADLGSTNGIYLAGSIIDEPRLWLPTHYLRLGVNTLALLPSRGLPLPMIATGRGHLEVTITPSQVLPRGVVELEAPSRPAPAELRPMPILSWVIPLVVASSLAIVLQMPMLMLFGLMAPAMLLGTWVSERHSTKTKARQQLGEHLAQTQDLAWRLRQESAADLTHQAAQRPSAGALALALSGGPREGLWSGRGEVGALVLGRGNGPTSVTVDGIPWRVEDAHISACGPTICVVGQADAVRGVARAMVMQTLLHTSPLRMSVCAPGDHPSWQWLTWCPHYFQAPSANQRFVILDRLDVQPNTPWEARQPGTLTLVLAREPDSAFEAEDIVRVGSNEHFTLQTPHTICAGIPHVLSMSTALRWAISMAPLRVAETRAGSGNLPERITLESLIPDSTHPGRIAKGWQTRESGAPTPIGANESGAHTIDLSKDGPHALVAGTTGAGKSELLRTWALSFALTHSPANLVMVLIDYKGGSAFADCAKLPHCVGMVTDLDDHLAERALTSLMAEIKRRERLLAEYGAADLQAYLAAGVGPPIPRLVVMIDEFRVLAEEVPAFVEGLVRLAALGRSLGLHVILATQRPAGVVTADIRANMNLRIALRLREASDSYDVVETPQAAGLDKNLPGRALIRTGADAPRLVQVARAQSTPASARHVRCSVPETLWEEPAAPTTEGPSDSDAHHIVQACRSAAESLGCSDPVSPWLPPLPEQLPLHSLSLTTLEATADSIAWGRLDDPAQQWQGPAQWEPLTAGHLGIAGAPRTGRTTWVRTLVHQLCCGSRAWDLYCFDYPGGLAVLEEAPTCRARVTSEETLRGGRVLSRLLDELLNRQSLLAGSATTSLLEFENTTGLGQSMVIWIVEGWTQFVDSYTAYERGSYYEVALRLLREGPAVGIVAIITGDRTLLTGAIANLLSTTWSLRLPDPMDLMMRGLSKAQIPTSLPPGRAVQVDTGVIAHVAHCGSDESGRMQVVALRQTLAQSPPAPGQNAADIVRLPAFIKRDTSAQINRLPVGSGGDCGEPQWFDLAETGLRTLVAGSSRSGKTSALRTLAEAAHEAGLRTVWFAGKDQSTWGERAEAMTGQSSILVLVDDAERLLDSGTETDILAWLADPEPGRHLAISSDITDIANIYRGLVPAALRTRLGIALNADSGQHGAPWGVTLPTGDSRLPGRGLMIAGGACTRVQLYAPTSPTNPS